MKKASVNCSLLLFWSLLLVHASSFAPHAATNHLIWQRKKPFTSSVVTIHDVGGLDRPVRAVRRSQQTVETAEIKPKRHRELLKYAFAAIQKKRRKILSKMAIAMVVTILLLRTRPNFTSGLSWSWSSVRHLWKDVYKPIKYVTVAWFVIYSQWHSRGVRRRQAIDATSEWSRYAANPAARGLAFTLMLVKLIPYWIRTKLSRNEAVSTQLKQESGAMVADSLLRLGPLYIKLGQIVSNQENLMPPEWITALERLQDKVPAKNGTEALELAYAAMGSRQLFDDTFADFEATPLAAASLGQVHRATLRENGNVVAVKLQRPYLREIYDQDLTLLQQMAQFVDKFMGATAQVGGVSQSWTQIFDDARDILYREIDYRAEADNGIRIAQDFGLTLGGNKPPTNDANISTTALNREGNPLPSAASWLRVPHVYKELSSEKVLVMEYVPSIKITNKAKLTESNITLEDREYLADCLARAYLRSFCNNCFFSTDPHAGNLGVEPGQPRPRLVMYDFGQACELRPDQAEGILDVIEAIVDSDADRCITAFDKMGVLKEDADLNKVRTKVRDNFETGKVQVKRKKLKKAGYVFKEETGSDTDSAATTVNSKDDDNRKAKDSEVMSYFTLPAQYAFVARALTQMDGVGKSLDPDFDFISNGAPFIVEIKGTTAYIADEWTKRIQALQKKLSGW